MCINDDSGNKILSDINNLKNKLKNKNISSLEKTLNLNCNSTKLKISKLFDDINNEIIIKENKCYKITVTLTCYRQ